MSVKNATLRTFGLFSSNLVNQSIKRSSSTTSRTSHSRKTFVDTVTPFILMYGSVISAYSLGLIAVNYWGDMKPPHAKSPNKIPHYDADNSSYTAEERSATHRKIEEFTQIVHMCLSDNTDDEPPIDDREDTKTAGPSPR